MRRVFSASLVMLALCTPVGGIAQTFTETQVPDVLKPWLPWVKYKIDNDACPFSHDNIAQKLCIWPTSLNLKLNAKGGIFTYAVTVYDTSDKKPVLIQLPGNRDLWPQDVKVDGKAAIVLPRGETPVTSLRQGTYEITGIFHWDSLPDNIRIPESVGLVRLTVNDHDVAVPDVSGGSILIGNNEKPTEVVQENHTEAKLFRKVTDGIPLMLDTDIELQISGKQREEELGNILPEGFVPVSIDSQLPVHLEKGGNLHVQLRPGTWNISISARAPESAISLKLPTRSGILPHQEIWSFQEDNKLRLAQVEGVPLIDPSQTEIPQAWSSLPSYLMKEGSHFQLVEKKRGAADDNPDRLNLSREIWPDFSGHGYTFRDTIIGAIHKSSRLEVSNGITLGNATINNKRQYITTLSDKENPGVEVREGPINMTAGSRIDSGKADFPVTGWNSNFDHVSTQLYLPQGWTLFSASGADKVSPTWIERWSLLDIFLVMIAIVAVYKLFGMQHAALACVSFVLIQHELHGFMSLMLLLLAAIAILRYLPEGRFRMVMLWCQGAIYFWLACLVVPFMAQHLREAIYPQLKSSQLEAYNDIVTIGGLQTDRGIRMNAMQAAPELSSPLESVAPPLPPSMPMATTTKPSDRFHKKMEAKAQLKDAYGSNVGSNFSSLGSSPVQDNYENYAPDTKVQTGFGNASWRNNVINLTWNGTVDPSAHLSLYLISATQNLICAFVRVITTLLFLVLLLPVSKTKKQWTTTLSGMMASLLVLSFSCLIIPDSAKASDASTFPPSELLSELKNRVSSSINEKPACAPSCASVSHTKITVAGDTLTIFQEVHADANIAIPLPGGVASWRPSAIMVDDRPAKSITENNGYLNINLPRGVYQVKMVGALPRGRDTIGISLPVTPHYTSFDAQGWDVQGIHENGSADNSIQLIRTERHAITSNTASEKSFEKTNIQPFFQVERKFTLGAQWQVTTIVRRVTPEDEPAAANIPLLPGETVTTAAIKVKDGEAFASLDPGMEEVSWQSVIKPAPTINLTAPKDKPWVEIWQLSVSNLWHVKLDGIPRVYLSSNDDNDTDAGLWQWQPWPGESLNIEITRPAGVEGSTSTIDETTLNMTPGQRSQEITLNMHIRSSLGGQHEVTLPENAVLLDVVQRGEPLPLQLKRDVLSLPLAPGDNDYSIRWKENTEIPVWLKTPVVKLGSNRSVNARIDVQMPQDRWILFTSGPLMGPAVLLWSWLPVIMILAYGLGKTSLPPLRTHHWFLLLLGLCQASVASDMLIIAWLFVLGWRGTLANSPIRNWKFNIIQIFIVILTYLSIGTLFSSIRMGLLGTPDMHITGNNSYGSALHWYQDITGMVLPQALIVSVPMWAYRTLMLLWSLWLAFSLVNWLRWGWGNFVQGGYWRKKQEA